MFRFLSYYSFSCFADGHVRFFVSILGAPKLFKVSYNLTKYLLSLASDDAEMPVKAGKQANESVYILFILLALMR